MKNQQQFLSLPNAPAAKADILILPVPYERTVSFQPGTVNGPQAILTVSDQLEFYEEDVGWCPTEHMKLCVLPLLATTASETEQAFHQRLFATVSALPRENLFIALGGEHSITPEMVFARMPKGGTVIQIDAHADLRPTYHGSEYNHACPMFRVRQRGYELIQIGIRSLHAREADAITNDEGITTYFDRELRQPANWQQLLKQLNSIAGPVWLTIDMDGFDPALVAGVGTPQPGGLSWHQGVDIIEAVMNNREADVRGIDILELIPEATSVSDMMAAKLVQKCFSYWGKAHSFDQLPACGSQIGVDDE